MIKTLTDAPALRRRLLTVPSLFGIAVSLTALAPVWIVGAVVADVALLRRRLPTLRLMAFAWCWAWFEVAGVTAAGWLWVTGRRNDHGRHYALQAWWVRRLIGALRATTGVEIGEIEGSALAPGPVVLLSRHASLADSVVSAWVAISMAHLNPHFVLKRELLVDPCLDIVGNRLPNHFLDRQATDSSTELDALRRMTADLHADGVAIIFPEGTRATPAKRRRALAKIAERDPARAERLAPLEHLMPPRPAGSAALLAGSPEADVCLAWHVGFDGLDNFAGILRHLGRRPRPIEFHVERISRDEVPEGDAFTDWLDEQWLRLDKHIHAVLDTEGAS